MAQAREQAELAALLAEQRSHAALMQLQAEEGRILLHMKIDSCRARAATYGHFEAADEVSNRVTPKVEPLVPPKAEHNSPAAVHVCPKVESMPALVTPTPVTCPQFPDDAMRADGAQGQVTSDSTRELGEAIVTAMSLPQPQLRIFRGDVLDFQSFMDSFDFRVGRRPLSDPDKLHHLKEYLDGEPRVLVEGCLRIPGGFAHAIKLLNETYGNEFKLAHAYMGKLSAWPTITESDDAEGLKALSCFMIRAANAMKGLSRTGM
jgi:hypothetical protein